VNISAGYSGGMRNVGENGYEWLRIANSTTLAYSLYMGSADVGPQNSNYRWSGFPLHWFYPDTNYQTGDKFDFLQNFDRIGIVNVLLPLSTDEGNF